MKPIDDDEIPQNEFFRAAMRELGYTRNQMCERMGNLSRSTFDKWMDMSRTITPDVRAHVLEILAHDQLKRRHDRLMKQLAKLKERY